MGNSKQDLINRTDLAARDGRVAGPAETWQPSSGSAIVRQAVALGEGAVVEIELLTASGGRSGLRYRDAWCQSGRPIIGQIVAFQRLLGGRIEVTLGGGSVSTTTNIGTTITGAIRETGWMRNG